MTLSEAEWESMRIFTLDGPWSGTRLKSVIITFDLEDRDGKGKPRSTEEVARGKKAKV